MQKGTFAAIKSARALEFYKSNESNERLDLVHLQSLKLMTSPWIPPEIGQ